MSKLRVLQVNKLYYPHLGGVETVVQQIAEGLMDEVDMTVLCCMPKGKGKDDVVNGVRVVRAGSWGTVASMPVSLQFIKKFRHMTRNADVVHLHMPFPLGDLAALLSGYEGRVIAWWHSDVVRQKALMKIYAPVMHRFLRRADKIIVATSNHIEHSDYLPAFREKCVVIPYGVDPLRYDASSFEHNGAVRALFSGRLVYYKGVSVLLEALALTDGIVLDIVGEGPLGEELRTQARRLGIEQRVCFRGKLSQQDFNRAFHECDFFVLPSVAKSEAFGIVQLEAMASGKPVINTDLPSGVPLVSLNGETGVTVPPGDAKALADAMGELAQNVGLRQMYGKKARARIMDEYSTVTMVERTLRVYRDMLP